MADIATKNLEDTIKKILKRWKAKVEGPLKDIEKVNAQLEKLDAKKELTPDEEKMRARCVAARKKLQEKVKKANLELRVELSVVTVPPNSAKSEIEKALERIKKLIQDFKKGLPLRDGFRLKPDIDFDYKKLKFKKLGVILEWRF